MLKKAAFYLFGIFIFGSCALFYSPHTVEDFFTTDDSTNTPGPIVSIVSGPTGNIITNSNFTIVLNVNRNYGYYKLNTASYTQFPAGNVSIDITESSTLSYYGSDGTNTSPTNTLIFTIGDYPVVSIISGPSKDTTTNREFTVSLSVSSNFGYWATNSVAYTQFSNGSTVNIDIKHGTTELRYFGYDGYMTSMTQSVTYILDIIQVYNVFIDSGSSYVNGFDNPVQVGNQILFTGNNGMDDVAYVYDIDTETVYDVPVQTGCIYFFGFENPVVFNGEILFRGLDIAYVPYVYKYDGNRISDIDRTGSSSCDLDFTNSVIGNNELFFEAWSGTFWFAYRYEQSANRILDVTTGFGDYIEGFKCPVENNGNIYFRGLTTTDERVLFMSGGNIQDMSVAPDSDYLSNFSNPISINDKIFFLGNNLSQEKLYMVNDQEVSNVIVDGDYNQNFLTPFLYQDKVVFEGQDSSLAFKVYEISPSDNSVKNVTVSSPDYQNDWFNPVIYEADNVVVFEGMSTSAITQPFIYDGNWIISPPGVGSSSYYQGFSGGINYKNSLFFEGDNTTFIPKIYEYDGIQLFDVSSGQSAWDNSFLTPIDTGNYILFAGSNSGGDLVPFILR